MSEHNKAYLICENKCLVEGVPKQDILKITKPVSDGDGVYCNVSGANLGINLVEYRIIAVNNVYQDIRGMTIVISKDNDMTYAINQLANNLSIQFNTAMTSGNVEIVLLRVASWEVE